jgi:hypothetical protein
MDFGINDVINKAIEFIVKTLSTPLMPVMLVCFLFAIVFRVMVYYIVDREQWFIKEFAKRVDRFIEDPASAPITSFFVMTKRIIERTYYEVFELRGIMMRRKPDYITSIGDRLFLVQKGCAMVVRDTLKQVRHLKHSNGHPKMLAISKNVLENNPCFNKVMGVVPGSLVNDILNMMPGLFIVGGIFGTFLGIMSALPRLSTMNLEDVEQSKKIMDSFLVDVAFSMGTSIVGIIFSVTLSLWNALLNPEKSFVDSVVKLENSLDVLWNKSTDNVIPESLTPFDEHRNPLNALQEQSQQAPAGQYQQAPKSNFGGVA